MHEKIQKEYDAARAKRDELKNSLVKLEQDNPEDTYNIMITRDRLAYWEGKTEGLKIARNIAAGNH